MRAVCITYLLLPAAVTAYQLSLPARPSAIPLRAAAPRLAAAASAAPRLTAAASGGQSDRASLSSRPPLALVTPAALLLAAVAAQPAAAKAAASAVPFMLLGKSSAQLFPIQNAALLSWVLYFFVPHWKLTKTLALCAPCLHSVLYGMVLVHLIKHPTPGLTVDFSSLAGVMRGFTTADGVFAGWLHCGTPQSNQWRDRAALRGQRAGQAAWTPF